MPSESDSLATLSARWIDTPLGAMVAVAGDKGLHVLEFVERRALEAELAVLSKRFNSAIVPGDTAHLRQVEQDLSRYFAGECFSFAAPRLTSGTEFQEDVWRGLLDIPLGETWSYAQLAKHIKRPAAMRAVGAANGANPIAIIVPCHRVIGANGSLTGYGGKLWRKEWLLDHEAKMAGSLNGKMVLVGE